MSAITTTTAAKRRPRPPIDGSLSVLSGHADWQAEHQHSEPFNVFPHPDDPKTIVSISFGEFAKATHRVAHLLRPGRVGEDGEVAVMLLNTDTVIYMAMIVGLMRAGMVPFPMSPRNTPEAIYHLIKSTDCHVLIVHSATHSLLESVTQLAEIDDYYFKAVECPSLHAIYPALLAPSGTSASPVDPYPPRKGPHAPDDIVFYLHSSGSTGLPKPIPLRQLRSQEWIEGMSHRKNLPDAPYAVMGLPTFHVMGLSFQLFSGLASSQTMALFTPQYPHPPTIPNALNVLEVARVTGCRIFATVPTFLEAWVHSPEAIEFLATMHVVIFGGGPIARATGDKLVSGGVNIHSVYGATEIVGCCLLYESAVLQPTQDWEWLSFAPWLNIRWVPQGDDTYEFQVLTNDRFHPAVENLPDVRGYATKDLFVRHPTNPNLWKIVGRLDDVIVLSNAEKIVPLVQEGYLQSVTFINGAVMFGRARNQAGVLLELKSDSAFDPKDEAALIRFRNKVWPYVEEANKLGPQFARIFKEMIIVASPNKPFLRAAKGTVQRKAIYNQYASEIDDLYDTVEASLDSQGISMPSSWRQEDVAKWLSEHATAINEGREPNPSADLMEQGFDSLSATFLRNRILGAFRSSPNPVIQAAASTIPADIVFANPSIQWLAAVVSHLADPSASASVTQPLSTQIEEMIAKHTKDLPVVKEKEPINPVNGLVIILTGSTGGLGSHLLTDLLKNERIKKVYTFDRSENVRDKQTIAFEDRLLPTILLKSDKLVALTINASRDDFGLTPDVLKEIKNNVTHIIHNAWRVDFNLSLSSFERNIASSRRLIDFAASCPISVRFFFTSSVAAAMRWNSKQGPMPERVISDASVTAPQGYGASKYVCERIVQEAARRGLPAMTIRIGQISGATATGAWNTSDWVPIIIKSSITIGKIPVFDEELSWVPMDVASGAIVDALFSCCQGGPPELVNLVHPRAVSGQPIFDAMKDALARDNLAYVSYDDWLADIEKRAAKATEQDFRRIPALKTMAFMRHSKPESRNMDIDTTKAQELSHTLRKVKPLDKEDAALWIKFWKNKGIFD